MSPPTREPNLRFDRPSVLSEIDQPSAVVLARRCLYQQARSNNHFLLPATELSDVHRLRPDQIHRDARCCCAQSRAIEFPANSVDIALEVPDRIGQQHRYVRRAPEKIKCMEVAH